MQDTAIAWLGLGGFLALFLFVFFVLDRRTRRKEEARLQRAQRAILAEERKLQAREELRRTARERARIAYPELLDATEADKDPIEPFGELSIQCTERIERAFELIKEEISSSNSRAEREAFEEERAALFCGMSDLPRSSRPSEYLDEPARFIDCGDAGQIELFTAAQVKAARDRSGRTEYVASLEGRSRAPDIARRVIERAKAREEMIERQKQEAKDAITTSVDDLPPLPPDRQ